MNKSLIAVSLLVLVGCSANPQVDVTGGVRPPNIQRTFFEKQLYTSGSMYNNDMKRAREQAAWDIRHGIQPVPSYGIQPSQFKGAPTYDRNYQDENMRQQYQQMRQQQQILNHGAGGCVPNFSTGGCL